MNFDLRSHDTTGHLTSSRALVGVRHAHSQCRLFDDTFSALQTLRLEESKSFVLMNIFSLRKLSSLVADRCLRRPIFTAINFLGPGQRMLITLTNVPGSFCASFCGPFNSSRTSPVSSHPRKYLPTQIKWFFWFPTCCQIGVPSSDGHSYDVPFGEDAGGRIRPSNLKVERILDHCSACRELENARHCSPFAYDLRVWRVCGASWSYIHRVPRNPRWQHRG